MQKQDIADFIQGLLNSLIRGFGQGSGGLGSEIAEGIERSRRKLFTIGVSIALTGIGYLLMLWGIASGIDTIFAMHGLGFVLVGIIAVLAGTLLFKK